MPIDRIETALYRIPLPVTLSDATHGEMNAFQLVTARMWDADGCEGVGYTYMMRGGAGGALADRGRSGATAQRRRPAPTGKIMGADVVGTALRGPRRAGELRHLGGRIYHLLPLIVGD